MTDMHPIQEPHVDEGTVMTAAPPTETPLSRRDARRAAAHEAVQEAEAAAQRAREAAEVTRQAAEVTKQAVKEARTDLKQLGRPPREPREPRVRSPRQPRERDDANAPGDEEADSVPADAPAARPPRRTFEPRAPKLASNAPFATPTGAPARGGSIRHVDAVSVAKPAGPSRHVPKALREALPLASDNEKSNPTREERAAARATARADLKRAQADAKARAKLDAAALKDQTKGLSPEEREEARAEARRLKLKTAERIKQEKADAKAAALAEKNRRKPQRGPKPTSDKKLAAKAAKAEANAKKLLRESKKTTGGTKPKLIDITNAVRALATMLETSSGELEPIEAMAEEFAGTQIGTAFRRIYYRMLEDNQPLVDAFAPETIFPPVVHDMLKVGAKTVNAGECLRTAVALMDTGDDSKRKLRSELTEPIAVGSLSLAALFGTAYFVMPSFTDMYTALDMPVPPISAAVLVMSDVTVWLLAILGVAATAWIVFWFTYGRQSDRLRTSIDRWKLKAPLIGKGIQADQTYRMFNILHAYLGVGATEREALADAADATDNRAISKHLRMIADGLVVGTHTFADVLDSEMFPRLARHILKSGQRSGQTLKTIAQLEKTYEREAAVETQQGIGRIVNSVTAVSSLIFVVVVTMVTIPPLEMFGATLSYGG